MTLNLFQYITASYILLLPVLLNLFIWQSPLVANISGGVFVVFQILLLTQSLFRKKELWIRVAGSAFLIFLVFGFLQVVTYYAVNLTPPFQAFALLFLPLVLALLQHRLRPAQHLDLKFQNPFSITPRTHLMLVSLFFFILITTFIQLTNASTTETLLSPWKALGAEFWILFMALTILFLGSIIALKNTLLLYLVTAGYLLVSTSIAVILYKIGYGFDPFLHQAAEQIIAQLGSVAPKTPYYVGQYGIVVGLHKLLGISILTLDKWLLPVLFSFSLPFLLTFFDEERSPAWLAVLVLFIPFGVFISTTPQALANLFFLWILFLSFPILKGNQSREIFALLWGIALLAFVTHPLAGIPALLLVFALSTRTKIQHWDKRVRRFLLLAFGAASALAIPAAFFLQERMKGGTSFSWQFSSLKEATSWLPFPLTAWSLHYRDFFYELAYTLGHSSTWIFLLIAIISFFWLLDRGYTKYAYFYGGFALIFATSAILLAGSAPLSDVIGYERLDYPRRVFHLALLTLLPLLMLGALWLQQRLRQARPLFTWFFCLFLAALLASTQFLSYPRSNRFEIGRQYNVRLADIQTVKMLPPNEDFVVLANQSLSAAAIREYGFARYYALENGEQAFFYAVPTSGTFYKQYLKMVYEAPLREYALETAKMAGVHTVHLILSDYWNNFDQLTQIAAKEADEQQMIADGKNIIFTYRFSEEEIALH